MWYANTVKYKGKTFHYTQTGINGLQIYKMRLTAKDLNDMVQSGDMLYQVYVRMGMRLRRKHDKKIIKEWAFTH